MFSGKRDLVLDCGFDDVPSSVIHMLFMKFPIDVVWVDSGMNVVDLKESIQPFNPLKPNTWRVYKPEKPARYVIELSEGKLGTTFGSQFPVSCLLKTQNRKPRTGNRKPNLGTTQIGDKIEFKQK
jgi:uncharacterized membrane protein (UPF0127 family)